MKSDHALKRDVENELSWEPSIDEAHIGVSANDGVVTLSGRVDTYPEKHAAEHAAKRVMGVKAVANELDVRLSMSPQISDQDIATACVQSLTRHVGVPDGRIKIVVTRGWVTLDGTVTWNDQRLAAEQAIRDLAGIVGITNQITVVPRIRDVQHQIEHAFKRSAEVDATRVSVEARDGILHGKVRSWAELEQAEQAAWAAPGTHTVSSELSISP